MHIQKSFADDTKGKLYVVPTPIGNLEDITFRALRTLKEVDLIAAEDTRQTKKLLNHFDIATPLISYHEHNKGAQGEKLKKELMEGRKIAIVSDAGMPVISDPGFDLIQEVETVADVIVLPGANAALCALVGSGLPSGAFYFYGFLPRKKKELHEALETLQFMKATMLFYESPHRIKDTVKAMKEVFGDSRNIVLARELTKRFEEYVKGTAKEVSDYLEERHEEIRGEFCIVVEGTTEEPELQNWWDELSIKEHIHFYINERGMSNKDAIKQTAVDRGLPKREVYQEFHQ